MRGYTYLGYLWCLWSNKEDWFVEEWLKLGKEELVVENIALVIQYEATAHIIMYIHRHTVSKDSTHTVYMYELNQWKFPFTSLFQGLKCMQEWYILGAGKVYPF